MLPWMSEYVEGCCSVVALTTRSSTDGFKSANAKLGSRGRLVQVALEVSTRHVSLLHTPLVLEVRSKIDVKGSRQLQMHMHCELTVRVHAPICCQ